MTKNTSKQLVPVAEVIEPTEIIVPTADQYIEKAVAEIQQVSKTELAIEEMKKKYGSLTVTSLEDRPIYFAIVEGEKIVRNARLAVERKRKELNEFPLKFQRAVNAEAKRITDEIEPIEEHLKAERKKFEDAEAAEKAKEDARKRGLLVEAGFRFDGAMYTCGVHIIAANSIAAMEEAKIEYFCQEARAIREQERLAEERRQADLRRLEEQRQEMERQREEMRKEREELDKLRREAEAAKAPAPAPEPISPPPIQNPFKGVAETIEQVLNDDLAQPMEEQDYWNPVPTNVPQPTRTFSAEYMDGFEHCRAGVLELFSDGVKRTRAEFVELINSLQP